MLKRSSKKREHDFSVIAHRVVQQATGQADDAEVTLEQPQSKEAQEKNPNAVALGRLGGKKGGKARAEKLTPEQRREIAKRAAKARWKRPTA